MDVADRQENTGTEQIRDYGGRLKGFFMKRYLWVILGLLAVVAVLGGVKAAQIGMLINMGKTMQKMGPPPETVSVETAVEQSWDEAVGVTGTISAAKGVAVSNDAPGVVTRINFNSGESVRAGKVLVELDSKVERAQLASARSRMELARTNVERMRALSSSGSVPRSQLEDAEAQMNAAAADAEALQAQIARKSIRAPFSGKLGIREVNLGQYLSAGTQVTVLDSLDSLFVDFSLPQQMLSVLKVGTPVRLVAQEAEDQEANGKISAINPQVDEATRTIKVRASVENENNKLRPGMFAKVQVLLPKMEKQVIIPATAVVHAAYGDSVFIVDVERDPKTKKVVKGPDGKPIKVARQQFVRLGDTRGDFVSVLEGVKSGDQVVTAGAFKLRNNSRIAINNAVQPKPQLNPRPANTYGLSQDEEKTKS